MRSDDMFRKRRRKALKRALEEAMDPEIQELRAAVSERRERIAQLELELSDTRNEVAQFEGQLNARLGPLTQRLEDLEDRLAEARRRAERRAQWGDRTDWDEIPDVVEQFRKTWTRSEEPPAPEPERPLDAETKGELKGLFRTLAKRYHPDLVTDPGEKRLRERVMAKVNAAYASGDLAALKALAAQPEHAEEAPRKTRTEIIAELHKEIRRLDGVIASLQRELQQLTNSYLVRLMLDASVARQAGRDLLGEMANDLLAEIARLEVELAALE